MNRITKLGILLISALPLSGWAPATSDETSVAVRESGWFADAEYESVALETDLALEPKWGEVAENPPLSPRTAIRSAVQYASLHFRSERLVRSSWRVTRVVLRPVGTEDWVYVIEMIPGENFLAIVRPMRIVVLMDGQVIPPRLSKPKSE
jgi:hypothetical protein